MLNNTPKGILKLSEADVLALVEDNDVKVVTKKENRLGLVKVLYKLVNYKLTNDIALAMVDESDAILIIATAGGGKTSMSQVKLILEKIVRRNTHGKALKGNTMLCLVYNKQNVAQMKKKHAQLVKTMFAKGLSGVEIDDDITCRTMHSFCCEWRNEYIMQMGLLGSVLIEEDQQRRILSSLVRTFAKKYEMKETDFSIPNILKFYNLVHECLVDYSDMESMLQFEEVGIDAGILEDFYLTYDKMKKSKSVYDYTDMLTKMIELLQTNDSAREHIRNHYGYIVADEVQDFTPIMIAILRLIKGDNTPLLCIGDEDQCIYNFRGADIKTTLSFTEVFKGGKVFILGENRRCAKRIFDASKSLIEHNELRFDKEIFSNKPGGYIEYNKYYSTVGQIINIADKLKAMSVAELNDTVICYRERSSSVRLTSVLAENKIPFNVVSGFAPYSHELFKHMGDALDLLYFAKRRTYLLNLYKITEMTKADCHRILGYNEKKKDFKDEDEYHHFIDRDYDGYNTRMSFLMTMKSLLEISTKMKTEPLSSYIEEVWDLIKKYFWNWKKKNNTSKASTEEIDAYFEEQIMKIFKVNRTYEEFLKDFEDKERILANNQYIENGVTISTFHKLKGLEYKNVFIIDLADDIFPNFSRIELQGFAPEITQQLKESETRLMFVAMTRAEENLFMYYNGDNPSEYITWLLEWEANKDKQIQEPISLDSFNTDTILKDNQLSKPTTFNDVQEVITSEQLDDIEEVELELDLDISVIDVDAIEEISDNRADSASTLVGFSGSGIESSTKIEENHVETMEKINSIAFEQARTNDSFKAMMETNSNDFMKSINSAESNVDEPIIATAKESTESNENKSKHDFSAKSFLDSVLGNI